ncbi:hypothetical protein PX699_05605 [Sphingobium sp. H39-3-25]|uniref:hypothetical protein n=1 Tax=Sphingobium arseniciresistens TaxID=3030834 RepID=UPI0023B9CD34|nr:hypothetical protein [Sphingobium arseniciresistens]
MHARPALRRLCAALPLLAIAMLAACNQGQDNGSLSSNIANVTEPVPANGVDEGNGANEAIVETESANAIADDGAAADRSLSPVDRASIPARLHGTWAGLRADCNDAGDPLRLTVSDRALRYYESVGEATSIAPGDKGAVIVTARFSGEGDNWTRAQIMSVSPDGQRLTITTNGEPVTRKRCAAGA